VFRQIRERANLPSQFMRTIIEEEDFPRSCSIATYPCVAVLAFEVVFVFRMRLVERTPTVIAMFV
jgi:hypothetical protein